MDRRHPDAAVEEWVFNAWSPEADLGLISGHRLLGRRAWYWSALARRGLPLLHIVEWDVTVRAFDPMIVKAEALWAEHVCEEPMKQWSIGNETYASAIDDPAEGLRRAYGSPTPIAFDLEWYATGEAADVADGYEQPGVVHGRIDVAGEPPTEVTEIPAHRWHRWGHTLGPLRLGPTVAHTGLRAAFAFPDGSSTDWVLTADGWRTRAVATDRVRTPEIDLTS